MENPKQRSRCRGAVRAHNRIVCLFVLAGLLPGPAAAQEPPTPWRDDPLFQRLAAALDPVPAIDNHTHLLRPGKFDPALAAQGR